MLAGQSFSLRSSEVFAYPSNEFLPKRKRKPAGTPDPDAEVVYLSPEMLMESDRYVCEICNQSFQREQNLQMHRRRHKVPWKLVKRENKQEMVRKRVYVCPESSCLHHDPCHALGDLVGIKKHFRRKHSNHKQWVCDKCSKGYAVQSDYKAHIKICGTRGHSCDCGRVFSRVEAFIEHQDACKARMTNYVPLAGNYPSKVDFFPNSSQSFRPAGAGFLLRDPTFNVISPVDLEVKKKQQQKKEKYVGGENSKCFSHNLELELFTSNCSLNVNSITYTNHDEEAGEEGEGYVEEMPEEAFRLRMEAKELSRIAVEQKRMAEEKRKEARCLIGLAMQDMNKAQRIREEAVADFHAARVLKECAARKMMNSSNVLQIACNGCRKEFLALSSSTSSQDQEICYNQNNNIAEQPLLSSVSTIHQDGRNCSSLMFLATYDHHHHP